MSYLVFNVGCIECGVSSNVVGVFKTEDEALAIASRLAKTHGWREGGQNSFEVYKLGSVGKITPEYETAPET